VPQDSASTVKHAFVGPFGRRLHTLVHKFSEGNSGSLNNTYHFDDVERLTDEHLCGMSV